MKKTQGVSADEALVMNVDEALAYADDNSPLPFKTVNTWKCVLTLADEVHSLREQNRRLRTSAPVFDMEAAVKAAIVGSCPPNESFLEHDEYVRNVLTSVLPYLMSAAKKEGGEADNLQPSAVPGAAVEAFYAEIKRRYPDAYVEPDADTKADVSAGISAAVNAAQPDMGALRRERDALREALQNMMGAFDTPVRRLKFPNSFGDEACLIGRSTLDTYAGPKP